MVINEALHPRILELLRRFKADIYSPQSATLSPHPQEHRKASSEFGRVWMKQKGTKLFMWLVGGPAAWGSFLIWAAASDSIASKVALGLATAAGVGSLALSIVRDRSKMTLEELECFLPALDCQPVERLYCEILCLALKSQVMDQTQRSDTMKLLNELLELDYSLAVHEQNLGLASAEAIERQLKRLEDKRATEFDEVRDQLKSRLEQVESEQPMMDRLAAIRSLIEAALIGLRYDLSRSNRITALSTDPLNKAKELLGQTFGQLRSMDEAYDELNRFVNGLENAPTLESAPQAHESPSAAEQRGTSS